RQAHLQDRVGKHQVSGPLRQHGGSPVVAHAAEEDNPGGVEDVTQFLLGVAKGPAIEDTPPAGAGGDGGFGAQPVQRPGAVPSDDPGAARSLPLPLKRALRELLKRSPSASWASRRARPWRRPRRRAPVVAGTLVPRFSSRLVLSWTKWRGPPL